MNNSNDGTAYITSRFMTLDTPTREGRVYPKELIEKAIAEYQSKIDAKKALCYVGYSDDPARTCGLVTKVTIEGNSLYGTVTFFDTSSGTIARELLENKVSMTFSCSGVGKVDSNGVVSDYTINSVHLI